MFVGLLTVILSILKSIYRSFPTVHKKNIGLYRKQQMDIITRVTFNLTCGKGVTELQSLINLNWSPFPECH